MAPKQSSNNKGARFEHYGCRDSNYKNDQERAKGYILKDAEPDELKLAFDKVLNLGYFYNDMVTQKVVNAVSQIGSSKNKTETFLNLTEREIEFLKLTCTELTYKEIADTMHVGARTVEGYRDNLCEKLELKTRVGLAIYAIKNGIAKI